jgi:ABC-type glycerol-3-phosphate transport system substrate-binding protein
MIFFRGQNPQGGPARLKGQNPQGGPARRNVVAGIVAAGATVTAGLYRFTDLFVKHYAPTPYDDLLVRLVDREQAAKLGAKITGTQNASALAAQLRASLTANNLAAVAQADVAAGRMTEVDGWVLPQTVALLAALASKV